jgi:hypothetical protein
MGDLAVTLTKQMQLEAVKEYYWANRDNILAKYRKRIKSDPIPHRYARIKSWFKRGVVPGDLTKDQMYKLWQRDKADSMRFPRLRLINLSEPYTFNNLRFVEKGKERRKPDGGAGYKNQSYKRVFPFIHSLVSIYNFVSWRDYVLNKSSKNNYLFTAHLVKR